MPDLRLLERETVLAGLVEYADQARAGQGRLVLVAGEAGVGKTALLERLEQDLPDAVWAWGACEGMSTPRALGPLFDVAATFGGELAQACATGVSREAIFAALLQVLDQPGRLTVLVVEDVHWADEATLDLLSFLGRRLRSLPALVLVTFRDDGLSTDDPLRVVVGELGTKRSTRRVTLPTLSQTAVAELTRDAGVDPLVAYRLTGGNPFFLTELLTSDGDSLPASARDAVLARVARLDEASRTVLDGAALAGLRIEPPLLDAVFGDATAPLDACVACGVVVDDGAGLRFRHEIARRAVAESIAGGRARRLHARFLTALEASRHPDPARAAYHAEGAGDAAAVVRFAPLAARSAADLGAHREAFAQYERALRNADAAAPRERAGLLDALANEASLIDRWSDAADAREAALPLWREVGDPLREGDTLRKLSRTMWRLCRGEEAATASESALTVLEPCGPTRELAAAYANLAFQRWAEGDPESGVRLAGRAIELAEVLDQPDVLSDAMNTRACAALAAGQPWEDGLRSALRVALDASLDEQAGRAYANLYSTSCALHRDAQAEAYYVEAMAYCDGHDIATYSTCLRGQRTVALAQAGRWDEAVSLGREQLAIPGSSPVNRLNPLMGLGVVLARRGDPDASVLLDEAVASATRLAEPEWLVPARLAMAEAAWLCGRTDDAQAHVRAAADVADGCDEWGRGAVQVWLRRLGLPLRDLGSVAGPYAKEVEGDHQAAATDWTDLNCPYDAALSLLGACDEAQLRLALAGFDELGATAAAGIARQRLRTVGATGVPAGPRSSTRANRFGLTRREQEVLDLLCAGLPNADISQRLFISQRTVDHHVSSVLRKMDVPSRGAAAEQARQQGLAR